MKFFFDRIIALVGLVILSPIFLLLIATNLFFLGRPIFFRQPRWGLNGKSFHLLKFRSMKTGRAHSYLRLTPYGQWLRKTSLDELPSLLNILKGDLAFVGPRPLMRIFYCPPWRHKVRPGLTGLAQIKGRNAINWRRKFRYDFFYIHHQGFFFDWWILFKTLPFALSFHGTDLPPEEDFFPQPSDDALL